MDDYTYARIQDEKERRNLAHQARKMKNGSKSRKCSLPCDHLTPKQLRALNGEVFTFAMNRPCRFEDLMQVDKSLIEEYLYTITDRFNPTVVCVSRMLGIPETSFYKWVAENNISRPTRRSKFMSPEESQAWNDWLAAFGWNSGYHKLEQYPVNAEASSSEEEEVTITAEDSEPKVGFGKLLTSFTATVETAEQLDELVQLLGNMLSSGSLSITVER